MKKTKKNIGCTPTVKDIQKLKELVPGRTHSDYYVALKWSCRNILNAAQLIKRSSDVFEMD